MGYFKLEFGFLFYGAFTRLNGQHLSVQIANVIHGHSRWSTLFIEPGAVTSPGTSLQSSILVLCGHGMTFVVTWVLHLCCGECRHWSNLWCGCRVENGTVSFGFGLTGGTDCGTCWPIVVGCSTGPGNLVWASLMWLRGLQPQHHCIWHCVPRADIWYGDSWLCLQHTPDNILGNDMDYSSRYLDFLQVSNVAIGWPA